MEFNNVLDRVSRWREDYRDSLVSHSLVGVEPWTSLLEDLDLLITMLNDPVVSKPLETSSLLPVNRVDRITALGAGKDIIDLYNKGNTHEDISTVLSLRLGEKITSSDIEDWIDYYINLPISEKPMLIRGSVFETKGRLEEMHLLINQHIEYIKNVSDDTYARSKTTKAQVLTEAYRELRQLYKDANSLLATIQQLNTINEFQQVVLDTISRVSPAAYQQIITELKNKKALMSALIP